MADSADDEEKLYYSNDNEEINTTIKKESNDYSKVSDELSQLFDYKSSDDFGQLFDVTHTTHHNDINNSNQLDHTLSSIDDEEKKYAYESHDKEMNHEDMNDDEDDDDDDDDDEDDVQVTIGDIKSGPMAFPYGSTPMNLNITKRGTGFASAQGNVNKSKSGIDMEAIGSVNGVSIYDLNLDALEDKPWRKPGADITDYFNYGFNEDTWKMYCERQKKLRNSDLANGVCSASLGGHKCGAVGAPVRASTPPTPGKPDQPIPIASVNENSKYAGMGVTKKAGPPPGRKQSGTIDVIGGGTPTTPSMLPSRRPPETKENFIQVIGNRPPGPPGPPPPGLSGMPFPPMSMPPPFGFPPPPGVEFPPGLPPPGLPLLAPNGQPLPFPPPGEFPPIRFPHHGILPHPEHHFEDHDSYHEGRHGSPNKYDEGRESEHERERDRERDYHRSSRGYSRDYRDEESYRSSRAHYREHHHERDYEHHERSRDRDYEKEYEPRRHRERDRETKDRDREKSDHRERDSKEASSSSSRRRHHEHEYEDEHSRSSSSSRHKHSKRSKREKEEETERTERTERNERSESKH